MTAEAAFDTPQYAATSARLAEPEEAKSTVTVITEDASYGLRANGWMVDEIGQLDVTADEETVVASFGPAKWIGVYRDEASTEA